MSINSRTVLGILLVVFGISVFVNNFGITDYDIVGTVLRLWPVLLVFWGVEIITRRQSANQYVNGGIVIAIGLLFLGRNFGVFSFQWRTFWGVFWPAILILVGWSLLNGRRNVGSGNTALMGSIEKKGQYVLDSGSYFAFWGGVELDLTSATLAKDEIELDLSAIMGGIELYIPDEYTVYCSGTAVLGGVDFFGKGQGGVLAGFSEQRQGTGNKTVKIHCQVIMGGIDIKRQRK